MENARPGSHGGLYALVALAMVLIAGPRLLHLLTSGHLSAGEAVLLVGPLALIAACGWAWRRERRRGV